MTLRYCQVFLKHLTINYSVIYNKLCKKIPGYQKSIKHTLYQSELTNKSTDNFSLTKNYFLLK
jgi:hypothetical protein